MSLIHWWPLNGDLNDLGINPVSLVNNGATVSNNGKIGKCYSFDGTNDYLGQDVFLTSEMSFACWVKFKDTREQHIMDCRNANDHDSGYQPFYGGINYGLQFHSSDEGSLNISPEVCGFVVDNWYHLAVTISNSGTKIYINGVLKGENAAVGSNFGTSHLKLGCRCTNVNWLYGYLNDVRIYDHALSAKEIKEISKGLVLHYDFNDPYVEGTTNYGIMNETVSVLSGLENDWSIEKLDRYTLKITALKNNPGYGEWRDITPNVTPYKWVEAGTPCTLSCEIVDYKGSLSRIYPCSGGFGSIVGYDTFMGRVCRTITHTSGWSHDIRVRIDSPSSIQAGDYLTFRLTQIELKDHATPYVNGTRQPGMVYDSSGYGYNGEQAGNIQILEGGPSGKRYMYCAGNGLGTSCPMPITFNQYTISCWFNLSADGKMPFGSNGLGSSQYNSKFYCYGDWSWKYQTSAGDQEYYYRGGGSANEWTHLVIVYDGSTTKIYRNGVYRGQQTVTAAGATVNFGDISVGFGYGDTSFFGNNKIADFKLFATPLSETDILAEYNRKASIDKTGNFFAGELVEGDASNIKVTKAAITKGNHFVEGTGVAKFVDGYTELEYIESTGTQYIDTGVSLTSNYNFDIKCSWLENNGNYETIMGVRYGGINYYLRATTSVANIAITWDTNNYVSLSSVLVGQICTCKSSGDRTSKTVTFNGTTVNFTCNGNDSVGTLWLFGIHYYPDNTLYRPCSGRIYYLKLYDGSGSLIRNFIPAKRKSDNALGLYDLANRKFYTNAGTGSFVAGPEVSGVSAIYAKEFKEN